MRARALSLSVGLSLSLSLSVGLSLSLSLSVGLSLSDLAAVADDEIGLVPIRGYRATAAELAPAVDDVLV